MKVRNLISETAKAMGSDLDPKIEKEIIDMLLESNVITEKELEEGY